MFDYLIIYHKFTLIQMDGEFHLNTFQKTIKLLTAKKENQEIDLFSFTFGS